MKIVIKTFFFNVSFKDYVLIQEKFLWQLPRTFLCEKKTFSMFLENNVSRKTFQCFSLTFTSLTQWTWVWVNPGSWWCAGRPGVLQSTGSQRVGHNRATELNWEQCFSWTFTSKVKNRVKVINHWKIFGIKISSNEFFFFFLIHLNQF